jgi:2-polyprenyl-3-methyl-5-hydroxy-6-metoxy-1,4-benzoquinol methylase
MAKEKLENFDKFAGDYKTILDQSLKCGGDGWEYYLQYKMECIKRHVGSDFNGRILDYGCGVGLLSEALVEHFPPAVVDGFDVSVASIENVQGHLKKRGSFTSDINHLGRDYDLIVVANVLHHIEPHERQEVIAKLVKILKKQGKIIIFEHNPFNPLTCKVVRESPLDKGVVLLSFLETSRYLKKAGIKKRQLKYILFFPKFLSVLRWAEPFLSWLPLGAQYVAIGKAKDDA